jgi:hypothetical protein
MFDGILMELITESNCYRRADPMTVRMTLVSTLANYVAFIARG